MDETLDETMKERKSHRMSRRITISYLDELTYILNSINNLTTANKMFENKLEMGFQWGGNRRHSRVKLIKFYWLNNSVWTFRKSFQPSDCQLQTTSPQQASLQSLCSHDLFIFVFIWEEVARISLILIKWLLMVNGTACREWVITS